MNRGLRAVVITQFLSALADNAILFAAIARLKALNAPAWHFPILQEVFVAAFVFLAPFVGPFADGLPKGRVLSVGAVLKLIGGLCLLTGIHPFIGYGIIGIGSAIFSPAKGGILPELCHSNYLIKANGWIEAASIGSILLGSVAGGRLADSYITGTVLASSFLYLLSLLTTFLIPHVDVARPKSLHLVALFEAFWPSVNRLARLPATQMSLAGTSLFWGTTSVLRFLLIAWLPFALHINDVATVGYLTAVAAVGIALGAVLGGHFFKVHNVAHVLPLGIFIGIAVASFYFIHSIVLVIIGLLVVGGLGGIYVIPLNAILQKRGQEQVGSGNAIAVQNLIDNVGMLGCVAVYVTLQKNQISPAFSSLCIGLGLAGLSAVMSLFYRNVPGGQL